MPYLAHDSQHRKGAILSHFATAKDPQMTQYFFLYSTAFAQDSTSDGPCLPTENQPGLRMALTVVDSSVPTTTGKEPLGV